MQAFHAAQHRPTPTFAFAVLFVFSSFSCAPLTQPKLDGMTPTDAQAVAIRAVRTTERDSRLELDPFDTHRTPEGDYAVSLQQRTTSTTARHWRVLVRPDGYAEVIPAEPPLSTPNTLPALPDPLRGDRRDSTPSAPEPLIPGPRE
jgi:hypothetical protein